MTIRYFGDDYLEFHDVLNDADLDTIVESQKATGVQFINPVELAYYTGDKKRMMDSFKCIKELKYEKDTSKHVEILAKYGLKPADIKTNTDYLQ